MWNSAEGESECAVGGFVVGWDGGVALIVDFGGGHFSRRVNWWISKLVN